MRINDVKIGLKISIGFIAILVLTAVIGFVGFNALNTYDHEIKMSNKVNMIVDSIGEARSTAKDYLRTSDASYAETVRVDAAEGRTHVDELMGERGIHDEDIEILVDVGDGIDTYVATFDLYVKENEENEQIYVSWKAIGDGFNTNIANVRRLAARGDDVYLQADVVEISFVLMRTKALAYVRTPNPSTWTEFTMALADTKEEAEKLVSISSGETRQKAQEIARYVEQYTIEADKYHQNELDKDKNYATLLETALTLQGSADKSSKYYGGAFLLDSEFQREAKEAQVLANTMIISFSIGAILAGVLLAVWITRMITKPISTITEEAKKLAATGDLSMRATVMGKDEIGEMALAINDMLDNTAGPVKELSAIAETIASGDLRVKVDVKAKGDIVKLIDSMKKMSENLKSFVESIAKNATLTAASAEELSASSEEVNASTEQVSSTILQISKGGQNLTNLASQTRQVVTEQSKAAESGMQAGNKATTVMREILETSKSSAVNIQKLDTKSKEISKIVEVINGISEQTNLLALNAAIEAARAGAAGRGVAGVAAVVRKLAEESQKATKQIAEMIGTIQQDTKASVDNMNSSVQVVDQGSAVIKEALDSLEKISSIAIEVSKHVDEVSSVAEESAAASEEVSASVQQTSASMQQVSSAAQELSRTADELKQLVSRFKVDEAVEKEIAESARKHKVEAHKPSKAGK